MYGPKRRCWSQLLISCVSHFVCISELPGGGALSGTLPTSIAAFSALVFLFVGTGTKQKQKKNLTATTTPAISQIMRLVDLFPLNLLFLLR
jgi:hypothetical protein